MPATRHWRRSAAIRRDQTHTPREQFLADLRDDLPRVVLDAPTAWRANGRAIECSRAADEFLRARGFDRSGRPRHAGSLA